jgi:hypothetical protein
MDGIAFVGAGALITAAGSSVFGGLVLLKAMAAEAPQAAVPKIIGTSALASEILRNRMAAISAARPIAVPGRHIHAVLVDSRDIKLSLSSAYACEIELKVRTKIKILPPERIFACILIQLQKKHQKIAL